MILKDQLDRMRKLAIAEAESLEEDSSFLFIHVIGPRGSKGTRTHLSGDTLQLMGATTAMNIALYEGFKKANKSYEEGIKTMRIEGEEP